MNPKPHLVGINHISLEVADIEEALQFYGIIFNFDLRGCEKGENGRPVMAFIDLGDQFLALSKGRHQWPDKSRHFGLVVADRSAVRQFAAAAGATGRSSTSSIPGATVSRSASIVISSSVRQSVFFDRWASISTRRTRQRRKFAGKAWLDHV